MSIIIFNYLKNRLELEYTRINKFFTITTMHKVEKRSELLEFAITCKEADDLMPTKHIEYSAI